MNKTDKKYLFVQMLTLVMLVAVACAAVMKKGWAILNPFLYWEWIKKVPVALATIIVAFCVNIISSVWYSYTK